MPLRIEIEICDRGSISVYHKGNTTLLMNHAPEAKKIIDELTDNAKLDVRPMNVLERFVHGRDPVVESVKSKLTERSIVGMKKYGTYLTRRDVDEQGWLNHLQQELLDAANYCECLIRKLSGKS